MTREERLLRERNAGTVQKLLTELQKKPNYCYIPMIKLMSNAGIDRDQIDFFDLFVIHAMLVQEARKAGIVLDYSEFDGMDSGVPFNQPAVVIKSGGITSAQFDWQSWGLRTEDDINRVQTRILQDEVQVRRYNSCGLINGSIFQLNGKKKAQLFTLFEKGLKGWKKNDYSIEVCDGWHWNLTLYSGKKAVRKLEGTVTAPPLGPEIRKIISQIVGKNLTYVF